MLVEGGPLFVSFLLIKIGQVGKKFLNVDGTATIDLRIFINFTEQNVLVHYKYRTQFLRYIEESKDQNASHILLVFSTHDGRT